MLKGKILVMNATITLLIYWSIALGLICGGLISLVKGFKLIMEGKGKSREESSIEFCGLKVHVSSLGSLVMITAFLWGWAAVKALPDYKDQLVEIRTANLKLELNNSIAQIASLEQEHSDLIKKDRALKEALSVAKTNLTDSQMVFAYGDRKNIQLNEFTDSMAQQQVAYKNLEKAVEQGDMASINEMSMELKEATTAVKMATKGNFQHREN